MMLDAVAIAEAMARLAITRPVFHSEADFQHALAWTLHETWPQYRVRLETRPAKGIHLDLLVTDLAAGRSTALELKYLTAAWYGTAGEESFHLLSQGAQDIRAYDCIKDLGRVETYVVHNPGSAVPLLSWLTIRTWKAAAPLRGDLRLRLQPALTHLSRCSDSAASGAGKGSGLLTCRCRAPTGTPGL